MNKIDEQIVLIGGGSGVFQIAKFLKHSRRNIATIQTMFDHGGHSGKLRDEQGVLPPGDIRRAILALSDDEKEPALRALLSYRFSSKNGSSIDNATMGNFMLAALMDIYGPIDGINSMCQIFGVKGKVLPITLDHSDLCAKLSDGSVVKGENLIDNRSKDDKRAIKSVFLEPEANIYTGAYDAIISAEKIVFCPGDLFTSIIPNTLVFGFLDAIKNTKAKLIYTVNIMTKKAETEGFKASKFAETLLSYIGRDKFDTVICNSGKIDKILEEKYKKEGAEMVKLDKERLGKFAKKIVVENLADQSGDIVRHNQKTAFLILKI